MENEIVDRLSALNSLLLDLSKQRLTTSALLDALTQFCVDQMSATFARIWLIDEPSATLCLKSSRGKYTRLDGTRSRIPVSQGSKIDSIYTQGTPHITNDVLNDPGVRDKDWAKQEGFVSFAGYPLSWGNERLGVLGMYSQHQLTNDLLLVLGIFTSLTSALIFQSYQTETNMSKFCEVTGFNRPLLDRLITVGRDNNH